MMRRSLMWVTVTCLTLAACGIVTGSEGSNTNWLTNCSTDADCAEGSCLCGLCTTSCEDTECTQTGAVCVRSTSSYCDDESVAICEASCEADADCSSWSSDLVCNAGACERTFSTGQGGASTGSGGAGGTSEIALGGSGSETKGVEECYRCTDGDCTLLDDCSSCPTAEVGGQVCDQEGLQCVYNWGCDSLIDQTCQEDEDGELSWFANVGLC